MEIESKQFGRIEVDQANIITMPKGIPGFKGKHRFVLLDHEDIKPFFSYQCVDDPSLNLIVMEPYLFMPDYAFDMTKPINEMSWGPTDREDLLVCVIVNTTGGKPADITANMMGPLLINTRKHEALQVILGDRKYSHKHRVFGG